MDQNRVAKYVRYGFSASDLLAGWENPSHYDIEKSVDNYANLCREALKQQYPDAEIDIEVAPAIDTSGVLSSLMETQALIDDQVDPYEIDVIEHLCGKIHEEYKWLVARPWLSMMEAAERFGVPVPVIRWMCKEGLIEEAEKVARHWEFPLDTFRLIPWRDLFDRVAGNNSVGLWVCWLEDTRSTQVDDLPNGTKTLVVTSSDFGIPLLSGNNSSVLVILKDVEAILSIEHFVGEDPWTSVPWSYDVYARKLVSLASWHDLESEWLESEASGSTFVEEMRFEFVHSYLPSTTLRELIERSVDVLNSMAQETEICLAGGPTWKVEYESDEKLFCEEVLAPLLRKMGFASVRYVHGVKEFGRDFIFSAPTKSGEMQYYGLQAKAGNISGGVNSEIGELLGQIEDAFQMPYDAGGLDVPVYIGTLIIAISGHFTDNAKDKIRHQMPKGFEGSVYFWDKEKILALIAQYWSKA
jgi:hypothetical protein